MPPAPSRRHGTAVTASAGDHGEVVPALVQPDAIYSQGKANIWRLFIVDVAGTRIVTIMEYSPGTAAAKLAEADAIVASLEFTP